jgi:hypothetical protein
MLKKMLGFLKPFFLRNFMVPCILQSGEAIFFVSKPCIDPRHSQVLNSSTDKLIEFYVHQNFMGLNTSIDPITIGLFQIHENEFSCNKS